MICLFLLSILSVFLCNIVFSSVIWSVHLRLLYLLGGLMILSLHSISFYVGYFSLFWSLFYLILLWPLVLSFDWCLDGISFHCFTFILFILLYLKWVCRLLVISTWCDHVQRDGCFFTPGRWWDCWFPMEIFTGNTGDCGKAGYRWVGIEFPGSHLAFHHTSAGELGRLITALREWKSRLFAWLMLVWVWIEP